MPLFGYLHAIMMFIEAAGFVALISLNDFGLKRFEKSILIGFTKCFSHQKL